MAEALIVLALVLTVMREAIKLARVILARSPESPPPLGRSDS